VAGPTLDLHGGVNKYAVYNGASDAPLFNPLANLANLLWHSDMPYIGEDRAVTGSINLDPTTSGWVGTTVQTTNYLGVKSNTITYPYTRTLATHGLPFSPFFLGYIQIGGEKVPLNGSFLHGYHSYNVYSDATGIRLVCERLVPIAVNLSLVCAFSLSILNAGTNAAGAVVLPTYFAGFEATKDRLRCGYFDTDNRYLIQDAAGNLRFHTGATINVQILQPKYRSATCRAACVVFKSGAYVHTLLASSSQSTAFSAPFYRISFK